MIISSPLIQLANIGLTFSVADSIPREQQICMVVGHRTGRNFSDPGPHNAGQVQVSHEHKGTLHKCFLYHTSWPKAHVGYIPVHVAVESYLKYMRSSVPLPKTPETQHQEIFFRKVMSLYRPLQF